MDQQLVTASLPESFNMNRFFYDYAVSIILCLLLFITFIKFSMSFRIKIIKFLILSNLTKVVLFLVANRKKNGWFIKNFPQNTAIIFDIIVSYVCFVFLNFDVLEITMRKYFKDPKNLSETLKQSFFIIFLGLPTILGLLVLVFLLDYEKFYWMIPLGFSIATFLEIKIIELL